MKNQPLTDELEKLKEELLKMARLLEQQVHNSVKSMIDKDINLAREVINRDDIIDQMQLDIEKKCLSLIAMKQPMAGDLRFIGTALRIIIDMERMADHAEDIAQITIDLYDQHYIKPLIDIPRMAAIAAEMIQKAIKAFTDKKSNLAMELIPLENEMDGLYNQVFSELLLYMMQDTKNIPQATDLLLAAGHLERIGDHATNFGEMVIYTIKGERLDLNKMARSQRK
ncbi:MAG: phosphate signaling complex protein PhoU [Syntrophomonadaceae bacterium]|nr:phosphate signaling complex protein PhoU [Syntrophomonadaceae bacterium]MDD4548979.1 phosphate signaling complex protein PhoU [Syntrophomonadaceae bacterium]